MTAPSPGLDDVRALHRKYVTLVTLQESRQARQDAGFDRFEGSEADDRRATFKALAREFPGALRELEVSTPALLDARRRELDAWLQAPTDAELPRWAVVAWLFHSTLARAIAIRTDPTGRDGSPEFSAPLGVGGRLLDRVWTDVARTLGTTPGEAERLLYPSAPDRGTRTSHEPA